MDKPSSNTASGKSGRQSPHTAATLVSGEPRNPNLLLLPTSASVQSCKVVTQPEARKQILRKSGRCFVCLRPGHVSRECRSRSRCSKCSRRHHTSICSGGELWDRNHFQPRTGGRVQPEGVKCNQSSQSEAGCHLMWFQAGCECPSLSLSEHHVSLHDSKQDCAPPDSTDHDTQPQPTVRRSARLSELFSTSEVSTPTSLSGLPRHCCWNLKECTRCPSSYLDPRRRHCLTVSLSGL